MLRHAKLLTGLVLALAAPAGALVPQLARADTAPPPNWAQSAAQGPSGRESAYMAYDSARNRTVLFGGAFQGTSPGTNQYFADTWEYDGATWTQIPTGPPPAGTPPAGALGQMVYDSARGVSVLFGGGDANGFLAPITWEWNGATWTPRFTNTRPPARVWFGMTYDSTRHVVVLFGGDGSDAAGNHVLLNDTWEYDGNDWRQVTTAHSPSGRYGHALAFDSVRGKTVLFAGHDDTTGRLNDTWEYDGTDWTQVVVANPPAARFWHSMAYVPALGKVVAFGGDYLVPGVTLGANNETWMYDGTSWQQLSTADKPAARIMAPVAYDSAHSSLVMFGGSSEFNPIQNYADTWALLVPQSAATLSVSAVQFPAEPVLSTTSQDVTVTNTGTAPLAITAIAAGGDFTTADSCPRAPQTVAINTSCTVTVKFSPSSGDVPSSGTLTVTDNAPGGSQSIPLSGSGTWGYTTSAPAPLDFGSSVLNLSGPTATATETLTFPAQPTILTGFSAPSPFVVTNVDCSIGAQLSGGASCHVQVGFQPGVPGAYTGQLQIHDNEPGLSHFVGLSGTALPIPEQLTWSGTGLALSGTRATLSAAVAPPPGATRLMDFSKQPVWVRFDVTDSTGALTTYYAQVGNSSTPGRGSATVTGSVITPGVYSVRARLVSATGSDAGNAYVAGDELRTVYVGITGHGGYMAGWGLPAPQNAVGFEFAPGSAPSGSLVVVLPTTLFNGDDGYIALVSTSVTSVASHSHTAIASGTASVTLYDAVTGAHYTYGDSTTPFQVVIYSDGSVDVNTNSFTESLPAGSGVNHL